MALCIVARLPCEFFLCLVPVKTVPFRTENPAKSMQKLNIQATKPSHCFFKLDAVRLRGLTAVLYGVAVARHAASACVTPVQMRPPSIHRLVHRRQIARAVRVRCGSQVPFVFSRKFTGPISRFHASVGLVVALVFQTDQADRSLERQSEASPTWRAEIILQTIVFYRRIIVIMRYIIIFN